MVVNSNNRFFQEYLKIRDETLKFYLRFEKEYKNFMCKKGCSECCEEFTILPIEFYYINTVIKKELIQPQRIDSKDCVFLKEKICQIYDIRPINCIIQGLPLFFRDIDTGANEVVICPKNENILFTKSKEKYSLFEYDLLLAKIITLNELFCLEYQLIPTDRISINDLLK